MPKTIQQLQQHAIPGQLNMEAARNGLPAVRIDSSDCTGLLYLLGATVTDWRPAGQRDVLFCSGASHFNATQPIRGGVPICMPWFGPHPSDPDAPAHGSVRARPWNLLRSETLEDGIMVELETTLDDFHALYRCTFGKTLELRLTVSNTSRTDQRLEMALHTYFSISEVANVRITGLERATYLDALADFQRVEQDEQPITFTRETDRVYVDTQAQCVLHDPGFQRRIRVSKTGSDSTVVWNPWTAKAQRLEDMDNEDWRKTCCIETANVAEDAITLAPAASHVMGVRLSVEATAPPPREGNGA